MSTWDVVEDRIDDERLGASEAIFALANGRIGIRGAFEERRCVVRPGVFVNGFYDREPFVYGERFHGYPYWRQRMTPAPDGAIIELYIDDEPLDLSRGRLISYRRRLDLSCGVVQRVVEWISASGIRLRLIVWDVVSFRWLGSAAIRWRVSTDRQARLTILSSLIGRKETIIGGYNPNDPRTALPSMGARLRLFRSIVAEDGGSLRHRTRNSKLAIVCSMHNQMITRQRYNETIESTPAEIIHRFQITTTANEPVVLHKYLSYTVSPTAARRSARGAGAAHRAVVESSHPHFSDLVRAQYDWLQRYWRDIDVTIDGDDEVQRALRFSIFQLLQTSGFDPGASIGAKGLTGNGYEGHYFWDTEIYLLPFFIYSAPAVARRLLEYRHATLPQARERAREMNVRGALYPWRTIDGSETSAFFPGGTAQYHIDADIAYAVAKYLQATGDTDFLLQCGAEIYVETARMWLSLGDWIEGKGFCFNMVTGPDEYTALVNNSFYTNLMARENLQRAALTLTQLHADYPEEYRHLVDLLDLEEGEIDQWRAAADAVYLPWNAERLLYPQDDAWFDRAPWKFGASDGSHRPLLLDYHPLVIYRYQIIKQPDVILALFLAGDRFGLDDKRRNFDYYEPLTMNDSALSPCIRGIMASEVGRHEVAWRHFMHTLRLDLDDLNGNTIDGLHIASHGGNWLSIVYGFAGFRDNGERFLFRPRLPDAWSRLRFALQIRGDRLEVTVGRGSTDYRLSGEAPLEIEHWGKQIALSPGQTISLDNGGMG